MHWIITKDLLDGDARSTSVGTGSYPSALLGLTRTSPEVQQWINTLPFEFRLLDGDDEPYYEGRCGDLDEADGDAAFAPLDWAESDSGCTSMQYRRTGEHEWEDL